MDTSIKPTTAGAKDSPVTNRPKTWKKCGRNLWRHVQTGTIYYYHKVNGKPIRKSLGTDKISIAESLKGDMRRKIQAEQMRATAQCNTFAEARALYEADLENNSDLADASKYYRRTRIAALLKSWPGLDKLQLKKITKEACERWKRDFSAKFDETNFNNTLGTLRAIIERGGIKGELNPAKHVKRLGVKPTVLHLPEAAQFDKILDAIEHPGKYPEQGKKATNRVAAQSADCADLVRFLAFSGCRLSEARQVTWGDVDFERGEIRVHNAKVRRTSNHAELRYVPIIPAMRELLTRLRCQNPHKQNDRVCVLGECEKSLTRACKINGIPRLTHHDLRHLFASVAIESGCDIPTVSRWLGHVDGGALAMRVYGHLRREHSLNMAQKVTFGASKLPENVTSLAVATAN